MAKVLCRCRNHPPANNRGTTYTHFCFPVDYPSTSSICGSANCYMPGLIFMDQEVVGMFENGTRVFEYSSATSKVKVSDIAPERF